MVKKMNFTCGCLGAAVFSGEIPIPEISLKCENCGKTMDLVSCIGAINSGIHSFIAECPKCHTEQKFDYDTLWKKCLHKSLKIKHREKTENILILLKTQKNKEKMIKFLEKGETDINKIHNKMIQLVVRKKIKISNIGSRITSPT